MKRLKSGFRLAKAKIQPKSKLDGVSRKGKHCQRNDGRKIPRIFVVVEKAKKLNEVHNKARPVSRGKISAFMKSSF